MLKIVLYLFSTVFTVITNFRNWLYDRGLLQSHKPSVKTIVVGNLSVGGTGKTPFVELIVDLLENNDDKPVILSRGYKRKSRGFRQVTSNSKVKEVGDEPFYLYYKFEQRIPVFVGEDRVKAAKSIIQKTHSRYLILDDGLQHRSISGHLNILLTTYHRPFYQDRPIPMGSLRESRKGAQRADIIVVTKCPSDLSRGHATEIKRSITQITQSDTPIFFSSIDYQNIQPIRKQAESDSAVIVTGIADAEPLIEYMSEKMNITQHLKYPDHYWYKQSDLKNICSACRVDGSILITTEKDLVKIKEHEGVLDGIDVYVQPMRVQILFDQEEELFQRLTAN